MRRPTPLAPRSARRSGWQLAELSMVLAILGMISVAGTRALIGVMSIERNAGQALADAETLSRLGERWRSDVHAASKTDLKDSGQKIDLVHADGHRVTYRTENRRLIREELIPRRRMPAREVFGSATRGWSFEVVDDGRIVAVVREAGPAAISSIPATLGPSNSQRIEAALGTLSLAPSTGGEP